VNTRRGPGRYRSGREPPEAIALTVCQYTGVSSSLDLPGGAAGKPLAGNPLSAFVTRRRQTGRLSCWLSEAPGAPSVSYRRESSLTGTSGHYGTRPVITRICLAGVSDALNGLWSSVPCTT
jgi:hypothetical protein